MNALQLIGNTPMFEYKDNIYVKLEKYNLGGSIKDRAVLGMLEDAQKRGLLKLDTVLVEATSGNTGIALAIIGRQFGYKVVIVMPESMSIERRKLILSYGAELILTDKAKGMQGSIDKVNDDVFSQKMMGDGIAIKPNDDKIYSPCDGTVEVVFEGSEHAIGIVMDNGLQVMIHCGLNTVNLTGICSSKVKKGDKVKAGQLIMTFDREKLKEENCDDITMLVVLDQGEAKSITFVGDQNVVANETEIAQIA